jgi:hypothetical protein
MPEYDREMGRHDADIDNLKKEVMEVRTEIQGLRMEVRDISSTLAEAKGGWRIMMGVAGISGVLGAGATKISDFFGIH